MHIQEAKKGDRYMNQFQRVFLIVLDSLGVGDAHDAIQYDDLGANTLKHICEYMQGLKVPQLEEMGLGHIGQFYGINPISHQIAYTARLEEVSLGKDTMTGHWEMMGLYITQPFQTFTETGFPDEFIKLFEEKTNRKCVGNYAESGTKILDDWGEHQIKTGDWIVYTSADSVFQIAAHEDIIPLEELYKACEIAREIAMDERWKVGRIIARPYKGQKKGEFIRTANRHDWALKPFQTTVLDVLKENNLDVIGIGKIPDIFVNQGISQNIKTVSNDDGMNKIIEVAQKDFKGLAFLNLVDFDALFGHRRNTKGYGLAIEQFDKQLSDLLSYIKDDDLLMITADHGNDPTYKGTDHTRENVPLIIFSKMFKNPKHLGKIKSYAVIGATIADNFNIDNPGIGESILSLLK